MTQSCQVGLVISSPVNDWPIIRLRNLAERLGPVKARTYRQASRVVNFLRAGYPVHDWKEITRAPVVLVCTPEGDVGEVAAGLVSARRNWAREMAVIFGVSTPDGVLGELSASGAACCVAGMVDALENVFLVAGDSRAVREAMRLIEGGGARGLQIRSNSQPLAEAAVSSVSWLLMPLLEASAKGWQQAGLTRRHARQLAEAVIDRSLRSYLKAGRRAWKPPASAEERRGFLRAVEAVSKCEPELGRFLIESAGACLRWMSQETNWLNQAALRAKGSAAGAGG